MLVEHKTARYSISSSKEMGKLVCLLALLISSSANALYFDNKPSGFVSFTSSGIQIKTLFDNQDYVRQTASRFNWPLLQKFYKSRGFEPVWCGKKDRSYNISLLQGYLRASADHGLNPGDYAATPDVDRCSDLDDSLMAEFDISLTNAFLKYSKDVTSGRLDPKQVDEEWFIKRVEFDPIASLDAALKSDKLQETLNNIQPQHKQYQLLQEKLTKYREIQRNRSWQFIPPGRALKPGDRHPHIPLIRRRLAYETEGGLYPRGDELIYDHDLLIAVQRFQKNHGLDMDGIVGPGTKQAMNMSVEWRIKQIKTSMERWRWMPRTLGESYILVNVPGFEMNFIKNGRSILSMRTITGSRDNASPSFQSKITRIIFNPTWTVPTSIAVNELIPQQLKDPNFISKSDMEVFMKNQNGNRDSSNTKYNPQDIDWTQFSEKHFPYLLVQRPGPNNSLGRIKFQTPNKFGIYLHDTPYRHLFTRDDRALSHGCIRLEKPQQLAAMLMGDRLNPTPESANKVGSLIDAKETIQHNLTETVPVYVIYMTTWVDQSGRIQFRDDIYDRDRKISSSLSGLNGAG
jgi:murein L,D-transpeptidase YcbB/YkuD